MHLHLQPTPSFPSQNMFILSRLFSLCCYQYFQGLLIPLFHMLPCLPDNKIPNPRPLNPKYTDLPHRNRNHIHSRYLFLSLFSPQSTFLPLDYRNPQPPPILAFLHCQAPLQQIPPPSHTPMLLLHHSQSLRVEFQLLRVDTSRTPLLSDLKVIA